MINNSCPDSLILHSLSSGYRIVDELQSILPDVSANQKAHVFLPTLFPKKYSSLPPLS